MKALFHKSLAMFFEASHQKSFVPFFCVFLSVNTLSFLMKTLTLSIYCSVFAGGPIPYPKREFLSDEEQDDKSDNKVSEN